MKRMSHANTQPIIYRPACGCRPGYCAAGNWPWCEFRHAREVPPSHAARGKPCAAEWANAGGGGRCPMDGVSRLALDRSFWQSLSGTGRNGWASPAVVACESRCKGTTTKGPAHEQDAPSDAIRGTGSSCRATDWSASWYDHTEPRISQWVGHGPRQTNTPVYPDTRWSHTSGCGVDASGSRGAAVFRFWTGTLSTNGSARSERRFMSGTLLGGSGGCDVEQRLAFRMGPCLVRDANPIAIRREVFDRYVAIRYALNVGASLNRNAALFPVVQRLRADPEQSRQLRRATYGVPCALDG